MKLDDVNSVFLEEKPSLSTLKACTFFWENMCVYESFIQTLPDTPELYDISRLLLEKRVLKIVGDTEEFRRGLYDKIYASFDSDFLEFLHKNADKIVIAPNLPSNSNNLIEKASEMEYKDKKLQELIDSLVQKEIEDEWLEPLYQNPRFPFDKAPKDFQEGVLKDIGKIIIVKNQTFITYYRGIFQSISWQN